MDATQRKPGGVHLCASRFGQVEGNGRDAEVAHAESFDCHLVAVGEHEAGAAAHLVAGARGLSRAEIVADLLVSRMRPLLGPFLCP